LLIHFVRQRFIMKPYTDKTDKVDDRKCLYSEIKANDKPRKKAARRKAKKDIGKDVSLNVA
jgi:hypothetical protein